MFVSESPLLPIQKNVTNNLKTITKRTINCHFYKMIVNDTLNMGFVFNILKENKIIFTSITTIENPELKIGKLIKKVNKI